MSYQLTPTVHEASLQGRRRRNLRIAIHLFVLLAVSGQGAKARPSKLSRVPRSPLRPPTRALRLSPRTEATTTTPTPRAVNGIRLVRGAGHVGRLEVSLTEGPSPVTGSGAWAPLCDDGSFTQLHARLFCQLLGFESGQQYYAGGISNVASDEQSLRVIVGRAECGSGGWRGTAVGRIQSADRLARSCTVRQTECPRGLLVGLHCSGSATGPNVSPPPVRAVLPPLPSMANAIRLIPLEANLQLNDDEYAPSDTRAVFRAELLVDVTSTDAPAGVVAGGAQQRAAAVWAPLCAKVADVAQYQQDAEEHYAAGFGKRDPVADVACNQLQGTGSSTLTGYLRAPIQMPDSAPQWDGWVDGEAGEWEASYTSPPFDPAHYSHWVTVEGSPQPGARSLQEMELKVSTMPCDTGFLFKLACMETDA